MDTNLENAHNAVQQLDLDNEPQNQEESPSQYQNQEVNPDESLARQSGWKPKEEWNGEGEWIEAAEFNRRGPLFDTIGKLKDEIRDYKKSADALIEHNKRLQDHAKQAEDRGKEKAVKELERKRMEAVQDGDVELFQEIDEEIKEYSKQPEEEAKGHIDPSITEWISKNDWFEKDEAMTSYMIHKQNEYLNKGLSIPDALKRSEDAVRSEFSHKFENPNKQKSSPVMGKQEQQGKSYTLNDLPSDFRPVYQAIARKMDMPLNEYVQQLKDMGAM